MKFSSRLASPGPGPFVAAGSSTMKLVIVDSISVTIAINAASGLANYTISPSLTDSLVQYKCFASVNDPSGAPWSAHAYLVSATRVVVIAYRSVNTVSSSTTGVSVGAGDLTDITITALPDTHGADAGFEGHGHTTTGHPVTDPGHTHTLSTVSGAITVNVDLMIIHI